MMLFRLLIIAFFLSLPLAPTLAQDPTTLPEVEQPQTAPAGEPLGDDLPTVTLDQTPPIDVLDEVESYLNGLDTLRARFTQINPDGRVARGELAMARPGRVRFEYSDTTPVLIVADGDDVTYVDYEIEQVTRWPIEETPLAVLLQEVVDLDRGTMVAATGPGAQPNLIEVFVRDQANPQQGTLIMTFARETEGTGLELAGWRIIDAQGYLTRIDLEDLERGMELDRTLWSFDDPRRQSLRRRLPRP